MRRTLFLLALIVLWILPLATLSGEPPAPGSLQAVAESPESASPEPESPPGEVLFDSIQYHVGGAFSVSSQNHTDTPLPDGSGRVLESFSADDFEVDGFGWVLDQVEVKGHYFNGDGPAASVNVYFLGDANGLPDSAELPEGAIAAYEGLPFVDGVPAQGDLIIPLLDEEGAATSLRLEPGTYWLVVQVDLDLAQSQWGFTAIETEPGSGRGLGHESAWMQNFPGFNDRCVETWGSRLTDCRITGPMMPPHPDFGFILRGTRQPPAIVEIPTLSPLALLALAASLVWISFSRLRKSRRGRLADH